MKIGRKRLWKLLGKAVMLALWPMALSILYVIWLGWVPPFTTPLMVLNGRNGLEGKAPNAEWLGYDELPWRAKVAAMAAEDSKFPGHNGFDWDGIKYAVSNSKAGHRRGGSTISQQVAKNVFLWPSRTWLRKGLEVWFTVLIETFWSKQRILQVYLNAAETGPGLYGFSAAAEQYFRKPLSQLSTHQVALIAAALPNPYEFQPDKPGPHLLRRCRLVERNIRSMGNEKALGAIEN